MFASVHLYSKEAGVQTDTRRKVTPASGMDVLPELQLAEAGMQEPSYGRSHVHLHRHVSPNSRSGHNNKYSKKNNNRIYTIFLNKK